jgi:CRP/FNR family cyclic AMP-dependent transcriptional regulator
MAMQDPGNIYFIWGMDDSHYGPVDLSVLTDWIHDERVVPETWVYSRHAGNWMRASEFPELKAQFTLKISSVPDAAQRVGIKPASLRRIKILADLKDNQLAHLAEYMEMQEVRQWSVLFNQGDISDSMYLVLAGELRARSVANGRETILATFAPGDFFGDMALFDHGPRSADVVANVDSTLLKITSVAFERLTREAPALATPFLQATARTMSARIRADNSRLIRVMQQYSASTEFHRNS